MCYTIIDKRKEQANVCAFNQSGEIVFSTNTFFLIGKDMSFQRKKKEDSFHTTI